MTPDNVQYALEQTKILYEPDRRIDTFGDTRFEFILLSGLMDDAGRTRVRSGKIEAERPKIIRPEVYHEVEMEGFSAEGKKFLDWLAAQGALKALLQYGFQFRRSEVSEEILHEPIDEVRGRLMEAARLEGSPLRVLLEGVDDSWEICLLKFTVDMIQKSHDINIFDFRRKGLI